MGYGLVAIPRGAWREANPEARLRFAFHRRARLNRQPHLCPTPALCAPPGLHVACPARSRGLVVTAGSAASSYIRCGMQPANRPLLCWSVARSTCLGLFGTG